MRFFSITILTISSLLILQPGPAEAEKNLQHYVNKYHQVRISRSMQGRLAHYKHLIDYFSSLQYIQPRHYVNSDFLAALIIAESAVENSAHSNKDARGLTQILYPTGKQAAQELAETGYHFRYVNQQQLRNLQPNDLHDPAINLLLACYLIAKYNAKYQGRIDLVVSAWNAGGGSIVNNSPPLYEETLDLIGKVNGYFLALQKQRIVTASVESRKRNS